MALPRRALCGLVILLALSLSLALFAGLPADGTFVANVLPLSLLAAVGMSLAYIPVTMTGMGGAAPSDTGLASGLINTTYQVGSALGLAVMVSLAASMQSEPDAMLAGYQTAFIGASVVAGLAALASLVFVRGGAAGANVPAG